MAVEMDIDHHDDCAMMLIKAEAMTPEQRSRIIAAAEASDMNVEIVTFDNDAGLMFRAWLDEDEEVD